MFREYQKYIFYTLDVFTEEIFGGNPLAVFPEAGGLEDEQMQKIAKEFNLSETVFVLPPENPDNTRRLRIFTPTTELAFAGHPTVGAAYLLGAIGSYPLVDSTTTIIFEEKVGRVPVQVVTENNQPIYTALAVSQKPEYGPSVPSIDKLAKIIGLKTSDIRTDDLYYPESVSCGLPFLLIPLSSLEAIKKVELNFQLWQEYLENYWAPHLYMFTDTTINPSSDIHARMFAPALGIKEDPATGSAAAALAGYLVKRRRKNEDILQWQIEQGVEMGRPSFLKIKAELNCYDDNGEIKVIYVGGKSIIVSKGEFYLNLS